MTSRAADAAPRWLTPTALFARAVQDRTIYEDSVFAKVRPRVAAAACSHALTVPLAPQMLRDAGHMEERDYRTYRSLFEAMSSFMRRPNIIVHLDVKPEESMERVKMRCEAKRGVATCWRPPH